MWYLMRLSSLEYRIFSSALDFFEVECFFVVIVTHRLVSFCKFFPSFIIF